ncbi:MAG: DMT family transporter [Chloroflexi bacterium]|nr:DMT family transporter [Chloroflexota bacterium]
MNWVILALLAALVLGLVNTIDSHLITRRMPSYSSFMLLVGLIFLLYGGAAAFLAPYPPVAPSVVLIAIAAGTLRSLSVLIMLYSLRKQEVSHVIPVLYTYPIFVALIAVPVLGESLGYLQWLAIIIVVAGAVLVSGKAGTSLLRPGKGFWLLVFTALLFALSDLLSKYVMGYISFWNLFTVNALSLGVFSLAASLRRETLSELKQMKQPVRSLALLVFNEVLALAGVAFTLNAIQAGPVSLVSTILGSRPIFVVFFAFISSLVFPDSILWHPGKKGIALRFIAAFMITGGIALIYLT